MTEQEAEVWATRLRRVWEINSSIPISIEVIKEVACPVFVTSCGEGVRMGVRPLRLSHYGSPIFHLDVYYNQEWGRVLVCMLDQSYPSILNNLDNDIPLDIGEKHLPFFRRGCWLSGCLLEASAHEKAEWIQGFTREEIEAWNLKF